MNAAVLVALVAAVLAILVMGLFLVSIAVALKGFSARLTEAISALGAIAEKTEPVGPAVETLERDLAAAQQVLASAREPVAPTGAGAATGDEATTEGDTATRGDTATEGDAATSGEEATEPPVRPAAPESEPGPDPAAVPRRSDRLSAVRPQYVRRPRPQ